MTHVLTWCTSGFVRVLGMGFTGLIGFDFRLWDLVKLIVEGFGSGAIHGRS